MNEKEHDLKEWLTNLREELSADAVILMDKRGFTVAYDLGYGDQNKDFLILSNVLLSIDSYLVKYFKRRLNYILIEGEKFYILLYRFRVDDYQYYLSALFLNELSPLGLILIRLENISGEFKKLIKKESIKWSNEKDNDSRELEEILDKLENNPLYKLLLSYIVNKNKMSKI